MADEIMPHVDFANRPGERGVWVDNLTTDSSTDVLVWTTTPEEGTDVLHLSEAQTYHLINELLNHVASWETGL